MATMQARTPNKDGKMIMDKTWEKVQQKTFTKWVNSHLRKRGKDSLIESLETDFADGIRLIQFLEIISTKNDWSKRYDKNPRMKIQKVQNVDMCMKFLKAEGVKLIAIQAENIVDGDLTLILGMIWTIIQQYQIADISEEELTAKEALLLWCKKKTKNYEGVDPPGIKNFHTSWIDGKALCALIHRHRPDLLDYSKCANQSNRENCELAFKVAEDKLGIPQLLDVEDLCETAKPDERSVITYVVQYYHVFAASQKGEVAGRRVGKLVDLTRALERLKNEYNERAAALRAWIEEKIKFLDTRDLGETEAEIAAKLAEYNTYKTEEKPAKAAEKLGVEGLYNSIQVKLSSNNRPAFVADSGLAPPDLNALWAQLLEAERKREDALRGARTRERQLNLLNSRLDDKANRLDQWISKSDAYLARDEPVESLTGAQSKLKELDAWNGEYADAKPRVAELQDLAKSIGELNGPTAADAKKRADDLSARFDGLQPKADAKQSDLAAKLAKEQAKEAARKAWAKGAKEYVRWCKGAAEETRDDRYFGDTLDAVEADKARLAAADKKQGDANAEKKAAVDKLWADLQALGVGENKYTPLTDADTTAAGASVTAAQEARQAAWNDALAKEQAKEAKRKEFAAAADAFAKAVDERRAKLDGLGGEPAPLIKTIAKEYADGKPEDDSLAALAKLQEECTALGITSNKHTSYNMPALRSLAGGLGRFVQQKQAALQDEHDLKHDYEQRAKALTDWLDATKPKIEARDVANTLDDARTQLAAFAAYRTTEKAEKANAKLSLEKLEQSIQALLAKNNRPAYTPPDALALAAIDSQWAALETAEAAKGEFLRAYLNRQEELAVLVKRFASDAADLEQWLTAKEAYLAEAPKIDTLYAGQYARVVHQSYDEEYANRKKRVDALAALSTKIGSLDYADAPAIAAQSDAVAKRYGALPEPASAKQAAIDAGLAAEQRKEDARIEFASRSKDFANDANAAVQNISDHNFGFTLDAVTAYQAKLDESDKKYQADADNQFENIKQSDATLKELGVTENAHTSLTVDDAAKSRQNILDALAARRKQYDEELAKQQRWDAARKAFAGDADGFVQWLGEQRKAVSAASGTPDERIAAIKAVHQEGKPGADRVAALGKQASAMADDGIVGNDYTGYTVPLLSERNAFYDNFVQNALANVDDEKSYAAQAAKLQADLEAAEAKEQAQFDFQKNAAVLLNWLSNAGAFLTEPIGTTSVEEVAVLKTELADFNTEFGEKESDYKLLQKQAETVADGAMMQDVTAKWDETKALAAKRASDLSGETDKQEANEALRKKFAEAAESCQAWLTGQKERLAATSGDLSAQMASLSELMADNAAGDAKLAGVADLSQQLDVAGVVDNPHTALTHDQLKAEYEQLQDAVKAKQKLVEGELASKQSTGVSPEQIAEFREVFNHFDKDKNQLLQNFELKACLNSLGDDPSDEELAQLMAEYGTGDRVTFEGFTKLMMARLADSDTADAIEESFRVIAGDKDFVTESDMRSVMDQEKVDYLVKAMPKYGDDGFDYKAWVKVAYQ